MSGATTVRWLPDAASHVLGRKLDSIPFSGYHVLIIAVLALVGFIEGYDLVMTGSLLVLAKKPLHLTETDLRWLIFSPPFMLTVSGFVLLGDVRPHQPQGHHADRCDRDDVFYLADPAGAKRRTIDHPASADRPWRRRRGFGAVPDRRRIDASATPAHL